MKLNKYLNESNNKIIATRFLNRTNTFQLALHDFGEKMNIINDKLFIKIWDDIVEFKKMLKEID